ncbi:MAG: hypothetical protein IPO21_01525 [Bacteroidales bacterium]|nr:hypothetical protein [Bacteroidales bacterium]
MEALIEFLKYTIPGLIVFFTAYLMIKTFLDNEQKKRAIDLKTNNQKLVTPIKLQAYERLTLFLERINPEALLLRTQMPSMTVGRLQAALLTTIRAEYDHNISQQIYISGKTWMTVRGAKDNVVRIINISADSLDKEQPATMLSQRIMETIISIEKSPTQIALEILKMEVNHFM